MLFYNSLYLEFFPKIVGKRLYKFCELFRYFCVNLIFQISDLFFWKFWENPVSCLIIFWSFSNSNFDSQPIFSKVFYNIFYSIVSSGRSYFSDSNLSKIHILVIIDNTNIFSSQFIKLAYFLKRFSREIHKCLWFYEQRFFPLKYSRRNLCHKFALIFPRRKIIIFSKCI